MLHSQCSLSLANVPAGTTIEPDDVASAAVWTGHAHEKGLETWKSGDVASFPDRSRTSPCRMTPSSADKATEQTGEPASERRVVCDFQGLE